MWYIQTTEYYSALKRNDLLSHHERYEGNLNAYNRVKKDNMKRLHTVWFQLYRHFEKGKPVETTSFSGDSDSEDSAAMRKTQVQWPVWEDPTEKEMATHSSILAWRIPCTEEPGRLQFMGWQRVRDD